MNKTTKLLILGLIMVLTVALLAACAGGGETYGGSSAGDSSASGSSAEGSTGSAEPAGGGDAVVNIALANVPLLDPATGFDEAAAAYLPNVYDTLVFPNHDGGVDASLATSWESSEDALVWTFHLRDDVKFHNGDPLTAHDVAFSMNRLLALGEGFAYIFGDYVDKSEAIDEHTVQFTLKQPFGPFVGSLVRLYIVNEKQIMEHKQDGNFDEYGDYGTNWLLEADAGSGPYKFQSLAQNQHVTCERFADYWGGWGENPPEGVRLHGTTEAVTIRTMMSRHELEISDCYQTVEGFSALDTLDGVDLTAFSAASIIYITLNNQRPPTDDIHFRKALAHLVDAATLAVSVYPPSDMGTSIVSEAVPGVLSGAYNYEYSLEKAEAELKQSKYYDQLDEITLELVWTSETPEREQIMLWLQAETAKLGIKTEITQLTWIQLMDVVATSANCPNLSVVWTTPSYNDAGSILMAQYTTPVVGTWETMDWVSMPEVDAMIGEALSTVDDEARYALYREVQQILIDNCVTIPLVDVMERHAYQTEYLVWPLAERVKEGKPVVPIMGYPYYAREMQMFPDKR